MSSPREGTVKNLQQLYTVVAGLALTIGIERIVASREGGEPGLHLELMPGFVAFLATLLPFYHGALRHLDRRYIEEGGSGVRRGALLADFVLLFVEACLFVAMAYLVSAPRMLVLATIILLGIDAAWGAGIYLAFAKGARHWAELEWVWLNIATVVVLFGLLWITQVGEYAGWNGRAAIAFLVVMITRTAVDYRRSWDFYFP